jgi:hypothetical protein
MSRFEFFLRVFVLLLAISGWAAFAGVFTRLQRTEDALTEARDAFYTSSRQNCELIENYQKARQAHESLERMQALKLQELQEKINAYELRLRQLGIIQESP